MREIKFRAWNTTSVKGKMIEVRSLQFNDFVNVNGGHPFELMQYTGLTDKNDVEIYEGDIVRLGKLKNLWEVVWESEGYYRYRAVGEDRGLAFYVNSYPVEVIGNIYENPELLT